MPDNPRSCIIRLLKDTVEPGDTTAIFKIDSGGSWFCTFSTKEIANTVIQSDFSSLETKLIVSRTEFDIANVNLNLIVCEPFMRKVVKDKDIVGINLSGICDNCKISVFPDDSTGILTTDKSIDKFLYFIDLYGKGTSSILKKTKTRGIWLGAWKDRKDNYIFGIDFVDSMKIIDIKTGNITKDDMWQRIYVKFEKKC
ncbi:unnamed protein product [Mytilus coruscus]|uniref:Uncharacterized protein n=1 Tax=Mytilus coruscus TaxID=42192 RepID=A0A6J8DIN7_MYTCO|nr:unnamed protein product [Mytilus coruscus]